MNNISIYDHLGVVNIWEMNTGRKFYAQQNSLVSAAKEEGGLSIMHLLYNQVINSFAVVSADHNIIIHSMSTFECTKQVCFYIFTKCFYIVFIVFR